MAAAGTAVSTPALSTSMGSEGNTRFEAEVLIEPVEGWTLDDFIRDKADAGVSATDEETQEEFNELHAAQLDSKRWPIMVSMASETRLFSPNVPQGWGEPR